MRNRSTAIPLLASANTKLSEHAGNRYDIYKKADRLYFWSDRATVEKRPGLFGATESNLLYLSRTRKCLFCSGFCVFKSMFAIAQTHETLTPLAAELAEDGRFRLFWCGRYVGGLWSAEEMARAKAAHPQSFDELITVLDRIARDPPQSQQAKK